MSSQQRQQRQQRQQQQQRQKRQQQRQQRQQQLVLSPTLKMSEYKFALYQESENEAEQIPEQNQQKITRHCFFKVSCISRATVQILTSAFVVMIIRIGGTGIFYCYSVIKVVKVCIRW